MAEEWLAVSGLYSTNFVVCHILFEDSAELFVLDHLVLEFDNSTNERSQIQTLQISLQVPEEYTFAVLVLDPNTVNVYYFLPHILLKMEYIDRGIDIGLHLLVIVRNKVFDVLSNDASIDIRADVIVCCFKVEINLELRVFVLFNTREIADEKIVILRFCHEQTTFAQTQATNL